MGNVVSGQFWWVSGREWCREGGCWEGVGVGKGVVSGRGVLGRGGCREEVGVGKGGVGKGGCREGGVGKGGVVKGWVSGKGCREGVSGRGGCRKGCGVGKGDVGKRVGVGKVEGAIGQYLPSLAAKPTEGKLFEAGDNCNAVRTACLRGSYLRLVIIVKLCGQRD